MVKSETITGVCGDTEVYVLSFVGGGVNYGKSYLW